MTPPEKEKPRGSPPLVSIDSPVFKDVRVSLQARLGETTLTIKELLALRGGSIIKLDRRMNDLVDLYLNDVVLARGEIVAVDNNFGVRIVDVADVS